MNKPATFSPPFERIGDFTARFTAAEFRAMCEAGAFADMKVELVEGELQRMSPPMASHASRQSLVIGLLWQIAHRAGFHVLGATGIDLGADTTMACDVALLAKPVLERRFVLPSELLLAVEIAETTAARDLGLKRVAYATVGIPHYWVVDGARSVIHVHAEPIDGDYAMIHTIRFGEPLAVPGSDATIVID